MWYFKARVNLVIFLWKYPCKHQVKRIHTEIRMFYAPKHLCCLRVAKLWHFRTLVQLKNFLSEYSSKHSILNTGILSTQVSRLFTSWREGNHGALLQDNIWIISCILCCCMSENFHDKLWTALRPKDIWMMNLMFEQLKQQTRHPGDQSLLNTGAVFYHLVTQQLDQSLWNMKAVCCCVRGGLGQHPSWVIPLDWHL